MTTIVSAIVKTFQAAPFTREVIAKQRSNAGTQSQDSAGIDERQRYTPEEIKQILLSLPGAKQKIKSSNINVDDLSRTVYWQLRLHNLWKSGAYLDIDEATPLYEAAVNKSREIISELLPVILPKMVISHQAKWKAYIALCRPLIVELFSGDYKRFKSSIKAIFGGELPYEHLVEYVYKAINKNENEKAKRFIQDKIQELFFGEEVSEDSAEKWCDDLNDLLLKISGLLTEEEVSHITNTIQKIPEKEVKALVELFLEHVEGALPPALSIIPIATIDEPKNVFLDKAGWGNGYGKWVVTLGSSVLALAAYILNEQKFKSIVFGLGTLGIGSVLASAFEPVRKLLGFDEKSLSFPIGFLDNNLRKLIIGGISAVLTGFGYYINESKFKTLVLGIGTLGLGGVLASSFKKLRNFVGFLSFDISYADILKLFGLEVSQIQGKPAVNS